MMTEPKALVFDRKAFAAAYETWHERIWRENGDGTAWAPLTSESLWGQLVEHSARLPKDEGAPVLDDEGRLLVDLVLRKDGHDGGNEASWNGVDLMRDLPGTALRLRYRPGKLIIATLDLETATDVDIQTHFEWSYQIEGTKKAVPLTGYVKAGKEVALPSEGRFQIEADEEHDPSAHTGIAAIIINGEVSSEKFGSIDIDMPRHFKPAVTKLKIIQPLRPDDEIIAPDGTRRKVAELEAA